MRIWAVIIIGGALLAYGLTRPAPAPAPTGKAGLADLGSAIPATAPISAPGPPTGAAAAREPPTLAPPPQPRPVTGTASGPPQAPSTAPTRRTAEILTEAAIAALIIEESRRGYYATGRPCACPDDTMRNGRRCGAKSAYSRPGGASPLCYPSDVIGAMIKNYRARVAAR